MSGSDDDLARKRLSAMDSLQAAFGQPKMLSPDFVQDKRINLRVDEELKSSFEALCSANRTTVSVELKRFMARCVKSRTLL